MYDVACTPNCLAQYYMYYMKMYQGGMFTTPCIASILKSQSKIKTHKHFTPSPHYNISASFFFTDPLGWLTPIGFSYILELWGFGVLHMGVSHVYICQKTMEMSAKNECAALNIWLSDTINTGWFDQRILH